MQVAAVLTGGTSRPAWVRSRFEALVYAWEVVLPLDLALRMAHVILGVWCIETGYGSGEECFNSGWVRRGHWAGNWFVYAGRQWRAYDSPADCARDAVVWWSSSRYGPATASVLRGEPLTRFYYLAMDNAEQGPGYHPAEDSSALALAGAMDRAVGYAKG